MDTFELLKYYTGDIVPQENVVFVFGSNPEGRHGLGAAKVAREQFGARWGIGEGLVGNSYGIPTKDLRIKDNHGYRSVAPSSIIESIKKFYDIARMHPNKVFKIAYRNTYRRSLCGYSGLELFNMFRSAGDFPSNVHISEEWYNAFVKGKSIN